MNQATRFAKHFPFAAEISEKYRKYLCKFRIGQQDYYAVWGTEMGGEGKDKFLMDRYKRIIISQNSQRLFAYLIDNQVVGFEDKEAIRMWLSAFSKMDRFRRAYVFYNFDADKLLIERIENRKDLDYATALQIVNFLWVVVDYVYPSERKDLIRIYENPTIDRFLACMMNGYEANFPKSRFSIPKLRENLLLLWTAFEKSLRIV